MNRRSFIQNTALGSTVALLADASCRVNESENLDNDATRSFELDELTVADLRSAMNAGKYSSKQITEMYLRRIEETDRQGPTLRSLLDINPEALEIAESMDQVRREEGAQGALHGIPVVLKDNLDTADRMTTTAGSLALEGSIPLRDSFVARRLRDAGAVLLAKANLSEWANYRSNRSSSGWSGRGGQSRNPYALDRNPSGSSSGSAVAVSANLCSVSIGTETWGSIVSPSNANGVVGLKPTVGLVSRSGIVPISHTFDTAGPITRNVEDAAVVLGAIAGIDSRDPATLASKGHSHQNYTQFLNPEGLNGARIGVARQHFGFHEEVDSLIEAALSALKQLGAEVIDPVDFPTFRKFHEAAETVMLYEFEKNLNEYLKDLGPEAPVRSLAEIIQFNERHSDREMPYFKQEVFLESQEKGPLTSREYQEALCRAHQMTRADGIDFVVERYKLDAVVAPTGGPAGKTDLLNGDHSLGGSAAFPAIAGYPNLTVPVGMVHALPVGISFFGTAWSEPTLIKLAYSFERATQFRSKPKFLPTLGLY